MVRSAAAGAQMHGSQPDVAPRLRRQAAAAAMGVLAQERLGLPRDTRRRTVHIVSVRRRSYQPKFV